MRWICIVHFLFLSSLAFTQGKADKFFSEGHAKYLAGDLPGAISNFTKAIAVDPDYAEAYYSRGVCKREAGDSIGAMADFNSTILHNPDHVDAYINLGCIKDNAGDHEGAIKVYDKAIEKNKSPKALNNRGFSKYLLKRYDEALQDFDAAIGIDKTYFTPYVNRITVFTERKEFPLVEAEFVKLAELFPGNSNTYFNRAQYEELKGDYQSASLDYDKGVAINPNSFDAYLARAKFRDDHGANDMGAIEDCDKAIRINPKSAMAYYYRARPKYDLKDYQGVTEDCSKAIALSPNYFDAYVMRGDTRDYLGDYEGALRDYDKAISLNPADEGVYLQKSIAQGIRKDYRAAIQTLDIGLVVNPAYVKGLIQRAACKLLSQDFKGAIADYSSVIKIDSTIPESYVGRAIARDSIKDVDGTCRDMLKLFLSFHSAEGYEYVKAHCPKITETRSFQFCELMVQGNEKQERGDLPAAIDLFTKAINTCPDSASGYFNRGKARRLQDKYEDAVADYRLSLQKNPKLASTYISIGVCKQLAGDLDSALYYSLESIKYDAQNSMSYDNIGIIYAQRKEYAKAIECFTKAVEFSDITAKKDVLFDKIKPLMMRAECYLMLGQKELACFDFRKAEELGSGAAISKRIMNCK